jgi:hypothetical protein
MVHPLNYAFNLGEKNYFFHAKSAEARKIRGHPQRTGDREKRSFILCALCAFTLCPLREKVAYNPQ